MPFLASRYGINFAGTSQGTSFKKTSLKEVRIMLISPSGHTACQHYWPFILGISNVLSLLFSKTWYIIDKSTLKLDAHVDLFLISSVLVYSAWVFIGNLSLYYMPSGYVQSRTTRIYLDGRVLRPIIKTRPSFGYFSTVIHISKIQL